MTASYEETLSSIQEYATDVHNAQEGLMDVDDERQSETWQARLDRTVAELRDRLEEQKEALERLRPTALRPSKNPRERLQQLHTIKAAYEFLGTEKPILPSPNSALPALLATRVLRETISSTEAAIGTDRDRLGKEQCRLEDEEMRLRDAQLLTSALRDRLTRLRTAWQPEQQHEPLLEDSASNPVPKVLRERRERRLHYDTEIKRLNNSLRLFIQDHLAAMLAAEELGGPIVGDVLDVDDEALGAGFSAQGRPRAASKSEKADRKRQRRIDEIWGTDMNEGDEEAPRNEREAAAADFLELIEQLLGAQSAEGANPYFALKRDSAASRFVVRAKVGHFHPKDARRLRLFDFGRELDD